MNDDRWHPRRVWLPALAAAAVLLMSFHQVVAGAVRQAHAERHASAVYQGAVHDCTQLHDNASRLLCTSRLAAQQQADGPAYAAMAGDAASSENWRR
jgi:hypothetical protein